jgi:hypothetical protein
VLLCATLQLSVGCGGKSTPTVSKVPPATEPDDADTMTALAAKGWGTLKGKVTLDGEMPDKEPLKALEAKTECHGGSLEEKISQTWLVNDNKEVANVAVWIRPPKGKFFKIKDEDKDRSSEEILLRQPHCAFMPHVLTLFPSYNDGMKQKPTGQQLVVVNNAKITHNTKIEGSPTKNPTFDTAALPAGEKKTVKPPRRPQDTPLIAGCNIHPWMNAKIWVFDHPYSAVTNEKGEYEIKNIPAGAKVNVVAWHEGAPKEWVLPADGPSMEGQEIQFEDGKTTSLDFKVKRK